MPSKRTNDSVDRILQELNQQQTAAGVQDSVTDHQIDEILRSVGISAAPLQGTPEQDHRIAFSGLDDLDEPEAPYAGARTVQPAAPAAVPPRTAPAQQVPVRQQAPAQQPAPRADTGTLGDTTRTGIIKGFLLKMAPDANVADTTALNQGKNQFQKFFRDSVAVVPDENGKLREPGKKKRGLFGLRSAEDTDEFVPINVSLGGGASQAEAPRPAPEPEPQPGPQPGPAPQPQPAAPARSPAKKQNPLSGWFSGGSVTEEIVIPEERTEERPAPAVPQPQTPQNEADGQVWHSKYTRRAAASRAQGEIGATGTIYRKKRNTVEFTPGQKVAAAPPAPQPEPKAGEPVGEPLHLPQQDPRSGFTMDLGALDAAPVDSTREFMQAYNAVRPQRSTLRPAAPKTAPAPAQPAVSQPSAVQAPPAAPQTPARARTAPAGRDPNADTVVVGLAAQVGELFDRHEPDDVDRLVDTLTGKIRLTPQEPEPAGDTKDLGAAPLHSGFTQSLGGDTKDLGAAPLHSGFTQNLAGSAPVAHSGFTQNLAGGAPAAHSGFTQNLAGSAPAAHSGFTQDLAGGAPAAHSGFTQDLAGDVPAAHSGFTQDLAGGATPAEPGTASFVHDIARAINTGMHFGQTERFDTAAARLTQSLQEQAAAGEKRRSRAKFGLDLTGRAADEQDDQPAEPFETAELPPVRRHDYERAEDAPAVRRELDQQVLYYTTASFVTGAVAAVLLILGLLAAALPVLPGPLAGPSVYPAVALVLLAVAGGVCWRTVANGVLGLAKRPTPDSLAVLPLLGAAVQCLVLLIAQNYAPEVTLLAGPAALVLCLNTIGKRTNACTVRANFRLVSAKVEHAVAYRLKDAGALRAMTAGLAEPHPNVLINRPTQIFRSFLTNSAAAGTSDKNQQQFAWLAGVCALVALVITLIRTKDSAAAVTALASVLCLGAPLAGTLLSALPARMMQRSAAQVGAVIPGWRDIRQLGRINVIQVTSRDLFPSGCVTLSGIKPVMPEHIDLAIVYAASVLAEAAPTLREVFLSMLGENRSLLAQVDDRETIYGKGYVGWVNKRRVLVGNRALMQDYGVKVPSLEYEQHHTLNQRRVIYLAVSGKMFAMFQLAYQRDPDTAIVLESLRRSGLSLVVDCDDFNCDVQLLEAAYSLPAGSVKVLTAQERKTLDPAVAWLPESEGNMLHLGSFASFVGGLEAAAGAAESERKASALVSAAALLGCVLGIVLAITGGLTALPLAGLVLYQVAWCVLALIFPLIQQY